MKIRRIFAIAALSLSVTAYASLPITAVIVTAEDGQSTTIALDEMPEVRLEGPNLIISTMSSTIEYPASQKVEFSFGQLSVRDAKTSTFDYKWDNHTFEVYGLKPETSIRAVDTLGRTIAFATTDADGIARLNLSQFNGVMIISTPTTSIKIKK